MLIDEILPNYDVSDRYSIFIDAALEDVWQSVWTFDLCESPVVSWLFWLRGLPSGHLTLSEISKLNFKIVGENKYQEVVLGLIGQPWNPSGSLQDFDPAGFVDFDTKGFAKCAWSFILESEGDGIKLTTETRVKCTDEASRGYFDWYWTFIRPFSGWTRKEMLSTVKRVCESGR